MRRSACPSQVSKHPLIAPSSSSTSIVKKNDDGKNEDGDASYFKRMPLFGFLEVPESLCKPFKIPTGCKITQQ